MTGSVSSSSFFQSTASSGSIAYAASNSSNGFYIQGTGFGLIIGGNKTLAMLSNQFTLNNAAHISWSSSSDPNGTEDLFLTRPAAATLQLGAADAAAPVAQTIGVQNVVAGTSNTNGANFTIRGSAGTGTGLGGSIIFQVAPAGTTGTAQNAFATALTINSAGILQFAGTTSSFPAIKRNGAAINFRLADDSADAAITAGQLNINGSNYLTVTSSGTNRFYVDGATGYAAIASTGNLRFSAGDAAGGVQDVRVSRVAAGILKVADASTGAGVVVTQATTVASLPAAATAGAGARAFVTDATATTYGSVVAGGGSNKVPVWADGISWYIG